ncbi:SDR family oxidoreductase [Rossellomorea vietnamensis]|uniref:dTDP-4-dehydrorhamnose reductase n=1 Tax=Rossellomorea vietnamensis TaxID=218284 RepID=A0A5D4MCZ6_9BACI|nr:SDR family oxidoreductase [Rossellomorea vietnamensis]TYR98895.1 SDR family oxidoreductase [Rossellomorea vietnamensis]
MNVLVLGGHGMAGHIIVDYLKRQEGYRVYSTTRTGEDDSIQLDVRDLSSVSRVLKETRPEVVINAVGLLNETADKNLKDALIVNSLLPHHITDTLEEMGTGGKLIHISTDCVFSGKSGEYDESSVKDGTSVYAKTKSLGEVTEEPHLTIRTSIIGPELKEDGCGLFLWFMKQAGEIKGFDRVYWNGVTTLQLAKAIDHCLQEGVTGLYHLCQEDKVSKYQLLTMIKVVFDKTDVTIMKDTEYSSDKSLVKTRKDIEYRVPGYPVMLQEMRDWMESR